MGIFNFSKSSKEPDLKTKFINKYKLDIENHFERSVQETIRDFKQISSGSNSLINPQSKNEFILDCIRQCAAHFFNEAMQNKEGLRQIGMTEEEVRAIINEVGKKVMKKYL